MNKMKKQYMEWKKILGNFISDKGLICKIYKYSYNLIEKTMAMTI